MPTLHLDVTSDETGDLGSRMLCNIAGIHASGGMQGSSTRGAGCPSTHTRNTTNTRSTSQKGNHLQLLNNSGLRGSSNTK